MLTKLPTMSVFAITALVALAAVCGCTGVSEEQQLEDELPPEGTGAPQMNGSYQPNGTFPEQRGQPPMNGTTPEGREQPQMDFASAAVTLGVTEEELRAALGEPDQGQNTFADAAATLGVSEEALMEALGAPQDGMPGDREGGAPPEPQQ